MPFNSPIIRRSLSARHAWLSKRVRWGARNGFWRMLRILLSDKRPRNPLRRPLAMLTRRGQRGSADGTSRWRVGLVWPTSIPPEFVSVAPRGIVTREVRESVRITRCAESFSRRKSHGDRSRASQSPVPERPSSGATPPTAGPSSTPRPAATPSCATGSTPCSPPTTGRPAPWIGRSPPIPRPRMRPTPPDPSPRRRRERPRTTASPSTGRTTTARAPSIRSSPIATRSARRSARAGWARSSSPSSSARSAARWR